MPCRSSWRGSGSELEQDVGRQLAVRVTDRASVLHGQHAIGHVVLNCYPLGDRRVEQGKPGASSASSSSVAIDHEIAGQTPRLPDDPVGSRSPNFKYPHNPWTNPVPTADNCATRHALPATLEL